MLEEITDSQKEITLTPALTGLLKPTTKLLGEELRNYVKKNIDKFKEHNREKNLEYHLEKINELVGKNERPNANPNEDEELIKNAEKLLNLIETIQDVDPSEKELSEIWQNIIASLRLGKDVPKHLIDTLKTISPLEASILIEFKRQEAAGFLVGVFRFIVYVVIPIGSQINIKGADRHYQEILKDKHLLVKTHLTEYFWGSIAVSLAGGYYVYYKFEKWDSILELIDNHLLMPLLTVPILYIMAIPLVIIIKIITLGISHGYGRYRLSWLGRELLKYVPRK